MELPVLLLDNAIKRGTILHSDIFEIDHAKFFVVIAVTKDSVVGFFYINSKVNGNVIRKEEQYKLQYQILPTDYSFLDHASYIDATIVTPISKEILVKSIKDNHTSIKGELSNKDLEGLLAKLRSSKLYSKHDKERYFF